MTKLIQIDNCSPNELSEKLHKLGFSGEYKTTPHTTSYFVKGEEVALLIWADEEDITYTFIKDQDNDN